MLNNELLFLPERLKTIKQEKLICNLNDREKYVIHIQSLIQAKNLEVKHEKVHRVIGFNQKDWLKTYIDLNTELGKDVSNDLEKEFMS